ncbi:MAG TPA: lamin tail domain-containing protein [Verrucomicrobiota bacterium]|nr:hypothetical protein [Verrucomicrobiales bacterium]HRI11408.1 lamin tail domain-containing protein [Verrucomicrobiota bacterium]
MHWRHNLTRYFGIIGSFALGAMVATGAISVSELNYNDAFDEDLEYIELINTGVGEVVLTGATFTSGIVYTFNSPTVLAGGERIVISKHRTKFKVRYGATGIRLADGAFTGGFANGGESVTLTSADGLELFSFKYKSDDGWPSRPAGLGSSLECLDPSGDLSDPANWRASPEYLGSPGRAGVATPRTVVINEILAHTDPPFEDAIELINLTDQPINIGGWYLSNSRAKPRKFRIPSGTIIGAHDYQVFYELAGTGNLRGFNPTGTGIDPSFTFNAAHGDEACLLSADSVGNPLLWMDAISFEATANGISQGRYPNGVGRLTTLRQPSFGAAVTANDPPELITLFRSGLGASNASPRVGPLVFSRIQYHPAAGEDEFLEIYNNSAEPLNLFDPLHATNAWRIRDGVDFDFPTGISLAAYQRLLVVGVDPVKFRTRYNIPVSIGVFGPWTNLLSNEGERVAIYQPDAPQLPPHTDAGFVPYVVVDEITYSPKLPWPPAADGTGPALRRKDVTQFGNDPTAWEVDVVLPPVVTFVPLVNGIRLSFLAEWGRTYSLEGKPILPAMWDNLSIIPTPPAGGDASVDITANPGFFRVRVD